MVPVFDRRKLRPLILALAIALCAFQLTTCTGMWLLDPLIVRATHVGLVLSMLFLWRSSNRALRKNPRPEPAWSFLFDILMIAMSAGAAAYIITNFSYIQDRMPHIDELTAWDLFWGAGLIIAILEATRRVAGLALVIVSGIALLYAFFGHLLPGNMGHLYLAPNQIIESLYLLNDGIWGSSIGASATIIYVFILFGALLEKTNMASVFLELACLVTRNAKGGPAKAAIFGSALFGSVSGSAAANVYATGTFTIPLMKRVGYRPEFSGAVEAVASSGGLIMPPVMGSIAFVMAEYTGISYLSICKAALLPAVLYYLSLFTMIHFEALRHGLGGTPPDLIPELRSIKRKLYYLAPLALLIVLMIAGRSIIFSALLACAAVVALSFLSPETRLTPARFLAAMENAAANLLMIAACCACVGIVIGVVTMTGFGFSFVNLMGSLAQVHIGIFLLVLAGTCVIFGMGLPSLPAYILVATFGAPALVQAGVPVLAAHLFVMYFAISSGITPPVCLVAYAGAAIADAPPMKTGFTAFKLGIAAFIVPFIFIFEPALLLMGDWATILQAVFTAVLYYLSLFTMIHFEALRHGLGGTPPDLIPELRSIKRKLYYLAPLALLIVLMIAGRSIIFSALLACAAVVALSFLSPETRLTPARFLAAMENAAANLLMIAACCACVGIVIGVVTMTGFGFSFVNLMGSLAQVHIGIFLLVLAGTCVIFGMGLPSLPAYILVATFGAPALVQAGVPVLAAHLFVMYFAISSGITPPVCLVAYAGAAIADAPPMKTGFTAFKLGIAAFIVPFIFIFEPALLLMGDWATILQAVFTAVLGVVCLASSMQGWLFTESSPAERVMMFVAGIVLVYPGLLTDLIGFGTASLVFFIQIARKKRLCAA